MTFTFHLVIPDRSGTRILLMETNSGWALPRVTSPEPFADRFVVIDAASGIRELVGLEVAVLRSALVEENRAEEGSGDAFFFTENLTDRSPHLGRWFGEEDLSEHGIGDERDRAVIREWFAEARHRASPRRPPWQHEGWFAAAASWIRETLPQVTRIEQFITWSGSSLLRIDGDGRRYYFKAVPQVFRQEAEVTSMLAEHFPDGIPRPVAIDPSRGWMLLEDFGDSFVAGMVLEHWEAALDTLLAVQRGSVPLIGALLEAGCTDRRPHVLQRQIEDLAEGKLGTLPDETTNRLRAALPRLKQLCAELAESPIPCTLVHGDFHAANVVVKDGHHLIFDWTDPCISHPFVDLATFFYMFGPPSTDAAVRARLRDRYLDGWNDLIPHQQAVEIFERTEPVAAMHHAISYQAILEAVDPNERWEWHSHLPWWLAKALDSV